jgi:hypothetical protein
MVVEVPDDETTRSAWLAENLSPLAPHCRPTRHLVGYMACESPEHEDEPELDAPMHWHPTAGLRYCPFCLASEWKKLPSGPSHPATLLWEEVL